MTANRSYLTVPALARDLGVEQAKILGWIHRGELRAIDVSERRAQRPRWRIPVEAWQAFTAARTNQPAAPRRRQQQRRRSDDNVIQFYT